MTGPARPLAPPVGLLLALLLALLAPSAAQAEERAWLGVGLELFGQHASTTRTGARSASAGAARSTSS